MDPISVTVVSALAAGATAIAKGFASEAIKDAYKGLKHLIVSRFQKAAPFVEAVEDDPSSEPEQRVLLKQLAQGNSDAEVKNAAVVLLEKLNELRSEPRAAAMLDFEKLNAAKNFELSDAVFSGTLLRAKEATFGGDVTLRGLRQTADRQDERKN